MKQAQSGTMIQMKAVIYATNIPHAQSSAMFCRNNFAAIAAVANPGLKSSHALRNGSTNNLLWYISRRRMRESEHVIL
jgi:hypothetical protein